MSDQNLQDQNKSNQNMNGQPETASDQIAPDGTTFDNLVVTKSVRIGVPNTETSEPRNGLYVVAPGGFPNNVPILAQSISTFFGARDSDGIDRFAINLDKDGNSYPVNFYDRYDGTWRRSISLKLGNVGIGTNNPQSMLHIGEGLGSGYRSWMVRGTQVSGGTDNVFFGLKREGDDDRQDAVIAWGDNTKDVFRFMFVGSGGPADGQEIMRLQANGNVGIGTNNPEAKLHLNSTRGSIKLLQTSGVGDDFSYDGGNSSLFGFTHYGKDTGETRFAWNNGTSKRDLLTIKNKGNVGIGTNNPQSMLHIGNGLGSGYRSWMVRGTQVSGETDNVFFGLKREGDNDRQDAVIAWGDNTEDAFRFIFVGNGGPADGQEIMRLQANDNVGDVRVTGDVYARNQILSSSRELKENIAELSGSEAVEALKNLNPVKFNFKADSDKNRHIGFIAEDVPELVATSDRKTLSPMDIVAVLTQALKEQQNTISALAEKVKLLEAKTA